MAGVHLRTCGEVKKKKENGIKKKREREKIIRHSCYSRDTPAMRQRKKSENKIIKNREREQEKQVQ